MLTSGIDNALQTGFRSYRNPNFMGHGQNASRVRKCLQYRDGEAGPPDRFSIYSLRAFYWNDLLEDERYMDSIFVLIFSILYFN